MKYLFTIIGLFAVFLSNAQAVVGFENVDSLRAYGRPTGGTRYIGAAVILQGNKANFYLWRDTSMLRDNGFSVVKPDSVRPGAWLLGTGQYVVAAGALSRKADTFYVNVDTLKTYFTTKQEEAASKQQIAQLQNWSATAQGAIDNEASAMGGKTDTGVTNANLTRFLTDSANRDAAIAIRPTFTQANGAYQSKGIYLVPADTNWLHNMITANTVQIATNNTTIAGKFTQPTGTTGQYLRGDGSTATFPALVNSFNGRNGNVNLLLGDITGLVDSRYLQIETDPNVPAYAKSLTGFAIIKNSTDLLYTPQSRSITINGTVQDLSGNRTWTIAQPVYLSDITVAETATVAIGAGFRNVVVTCTGVVAGERVLVTQNAVTPSFVVLGAIASAANQVTVQVSVPIIALGASYSLPCKVTVFR